MKTDAPHTLQDQMLAKLKHQLIERRRRNAYVLIERRALRQTPQDMAGVDLAFDADRESAK